MANTRFHLQQEYIARTSEVEVRAAAAENGYTQMHRELLEQRNQLQENQTQLLEGGFHLQGQYNEHVSQLRRDLQEAQHCWTQSLAQPLGQLSKGRELFTRETWQSKLRDGEPIQWRSLKKAELLCQLRNKRSWLRETQSINSKSILLRLKPRWMTRISGMTRNMGVNMSWCRRIKRMIQMLKPTRYNRLHLQQGSFSQHLSPLQLCKDMFLLNYYYLLPSSTQCETTTTTTWATSK